MKTLICKFLSWMFPAEDMEFGEYLGEEVIPSSEIVKVFLK